MSTIAEIDPYYIKAITALHSRDHLQGVKPSLQLLLEEAIKAKTGVEKNFTPILQTLLKPVIINEFKTISIEDSKTASSSDNELELDLDLLKEDLMCVICQGMDVGARNRLLECTDCHHLYHQECHQPAVSQEDAEGLWVCGKCKEKRTRKSPVTVSSSSSGSSSKSSSKNSPASTPRHSSSSGYKSSSGGKSSSGSSKSSSSKSSKSSSSSSSSKEKSGSGSSSSVTPNVRVIADKRIQMMKKKATKLHDKKKSIR